MPTTRMEDRKVSDRRETFKRKEVKYRLDSAQRKYIESAVREHLQRGPFGVSRVSSLYYDTPNRDLIARSLEKPLYKEKLRLRWYGDEDLADAETAFIELKKKFKGIVYKRRLGLDPDALQVFLEEAQRINGNGRMSMPSLAENDLTPVERQIRRELLAFFGRHEGVLPSALIRCRRIAYEEEGECGLRVTFDDELTVTDVMEEGPTRELLLPGHSIMEIKCQGPYPLWLVNALSEVEAYPSSFSKYGEAYKKGWMRDAG